MVRNDRRTRLLPKIIAGQLVVTIIVVLLSAVVVFYAQGYRVDFSRFKIVKTGVLYLKFQPYNATVEWNSHSKNRMSNFVKNLTPGAYDISVAKPDYTTWKVQLSVLSESVNDYSKIILFKSKIVPEVLTDQSKIALLNTPTEVLATNAPDQLLYNNYEIWVGTRLVTRFAEPLQNAVWYPDLAHIIYQQGKEIRIIELNGQNDTLLVELSVETPTIFTIGNRGTELYYLDGEQYKMATIR